MTKLRKLTALLLAGALALLLLTACGGGGSSSPEAQAEANVMRAINSRRTQAAALSNDDEMREVAASNLDAELKGGALGYNVYYKVITDKDNSTLTIIAKYDYKDTSLENLIGYITKDNPNSNLNFNQSGNWTRVGVVARTIQGQTYIAISLQIKT